MSTYEKHLVEVWNNSMTWNEKRSMLHGDAEAHDKFNNDEWASNCSLLSIIAGYLGVCDEN